MGKFSSKLCKNGNNTDISLFRYIYLNHMKISQNTIE